MTLAIRTASHFWDLRYSSDAYVFGKEPSRFVTAYALNIAPGSRIFLPADGEGRNSVFLAALGHKVTACDYSEVALDKARRLAADKGVDIDFRVADLKGFAWPDGAYDAVVATFLQFADPTFRDMIFAGLKKSVRPGGRILLHGYTPQQVEYGTGGPDDVTKMYTIDLLRDAFADCDIEVLKAYEAELDEGPGHCGRSALIDLVARKR